MPGKVTIKVEGAREIERALKEPGSPAAGRVLRSGAVRLFRPAIQPQTRAQIDSAPANEQHAECVCVSAELI